jgi:hypothetical protein
LRRRDESRHRSSGNGPDTSRSFASVVASFVPFVVKGKGKDHSAISPASMACNMARKLFRQRCASFT